MPAIVVLEDPRKWAFDMPDAEVVPAEDYLVDPHYGKLRGAKVYNLCRTYGYQTTGYYVSLLAAARGHKPLPALSTLQDLRQGVVLRIVSAEVEELMERALAAVKSDEFVLSLYFGRNMAKRYDRIAAALSGQFPAPMLRARFVRNGAWRLDSLRPIALDDVPESHRDFFLEQARRHFKRPRKLRRPDTSELRYDMAILVDPEEENPPSDERALRRFCEAARRLGIEPFLVEKDEYPRIAEYDALFLRVTTGVDHFSYRFARRGTKEGLVVVDDPETILRCTNKVYQAELFERYGIACPKTLVVHEANRHLVPERMGFPCVVKRPDSSFSAGVAKAKDQEDLEEILDRFFADSELAVVQEFVPSDFDWRIGILEGEAFYCCKYFMARGSWTIQTQGPSGRTRYGPVEAIPMEEAPKKAVDLALRATRPIGDGLFGVDVKQVGKRFMVVEVNDNPSLDAGYEDQYLGDALYDRVMRYFFERLERRGRPAQEAR